MAGHSSRAPVLTTTASRLIAWFRDRRGTSALTDPFPASFCLSLLGGPTLRRQANPMTLPKRTLAAHSTRSRSSASTMALLLAVGTLASSPALAQDISANDIREMKAAIAELTAAQAAARQRISELEAKLARHESTPPPAPAAVPVPAYTSLAMTDAPHTAPPPAPPADPRLDVSGDIRVRHESNFGVDGERDHSRGVLRARLRAAYAVNDWLSFGGEIATGDPDDPNSTDITLSNFDDDLQVSLDQAYIRMTPGNLQLLLGKMPQPLRRTDMVWDSDVAPEGAALTYTAPLGPVTARATALYFILDEASAGPDSDMRGGQIVLSTPAARLQAELAVGYYDYTLHSLSGADSGDFRTNLIANGQYLSDFNLIDVIGTLRWNGLGERWPVTFTGDYVHNFGADNSEDTGFSGDISLGRSSAPGDWRFSYGYAETQTDAVFAAFSHDNTGLATGYLQHSLGIDFVPVKDLLLNVTYYRYRALDAASGTDLSNRLRLNTQISF